ncbi:MAG: hypothetical protein GWP25_02885 [Euryarchaeota archaeon]|nr:hypothetical protein [Euryarchaeota archaeon]
MSGLLPGGTQSWHRLDESKADHYSQLQLKRCLHDRNSLLPKMEDKYAAREIVESKDVCRLPKLLHWSTSASGIPWDSLPEQCVIKTNHWSGDVLFIMDNGPTPLKSVNRSFRLFSRGDNRYKVIRNGRDQNGKFWPRWRIERSLKWCLRQTFPTPLEWGAASIEPRGVMVEELLIEDGKLPDDWKVHVFHGKAGFIQHDIGRMTTHAQSIYTIEGQKIIQSNPRWSEQGTPAEIVSILGQDGVNSLVEIAEKLAEDIDYSRVDLFRVNGEWVFGEYTNYHNSCHPQSDEWEALGGRLWLDHPEGGEQT